MLENDAAANFLDVSNQSLDLYANHLIAREHGAEDQNNFKFTFLFFFCKLGPSGVVEIIEKRQGPLQVRVKFNSRRPHKF